MVRDQTWRRAKYKAKLDGTVSEMRVDAYGDDMKSLHRTITAVLVAKEEEAKTKILEPAGVETSQIPFYLNAMREFCRTCRNWTSATRDNKCYSILLRYRDKGLRQNLLYKLAAMCGCYPSGYQYYV
jgi:hypothetical protein